MAKRRRRRSWYEVEEPRDPRLWLYGPMPSGFWDLAENRQRYVQWLGEQLGFSQLEDWYRLTRRHFQRHVPLKRLGQPEEMGALIAFLASGKSTFVTGQVIAFTGGWWP